MKPVRSENWNVKEASTNVKEATIKVQISSSAGMRMFVECKRSIVEILDERE